jgi:hypothetical protein
MGTNYFEQLGREILHQKRLMDKLKEENRELRRQIAELREGRGIFIKIGDQRIPLLSDEEGTTPANNAIQAKQSDDEDTSGRITSQAASQTEQKEPVPEEATRTKEVPFLEEVMLDEFASALTNPVPTTTPEPRKAQKNAYEERWRLRQDLQGSYILE